MAKVNDLTPNTFEEIPKAEALITVDPTQDMGATVGGLGGRLASTLSEAINREGNLVKDVVNQKLDTDAKEILGEFTFGTSGAIAIATDEDNGM